jgi:hypothetical protein
MKEKFKGDGAAQSATVLTRKERTTMPSILPNSAGKGILPALIGGGLALVMPTAALGRSSIVPAWNASDTRETTGPWTRRAPAAPPR